MPVGLSATPSAIVIVNKKRRKCNQSSTSKQKWWRYTKSSVDERVLSEVRILDFNFFGQIRLFYCCIEEMQLMCVYLLCTRDIRVSGLLYMLFWTYLTLGCYCTYTFSICCWGFQKQIHNFVFTPFLCAIVSWQKTSVCAFPECWIKTMRKLV